VSGGDTVAFSADMIAGLGPRAPAAEPIFSPAATLMAAPALDEPALPFRAGAAPPPLSVRGSPPLRGPAVSTGTLFVPDDAPAASSRSALPFSSPEPSPPAPALPPLPEPALPPVPVIELSPPSAPQPPPPRREAVWAPQPEVAGAAPPAPPPPRKAAPPQRAKLPKQPQIDVLKIIYGSNK
jgi:hypothetical protein